MKVKRFAAVALAGVMGMSMLAGCGDSGKDESTTAAKSDASEATDATEAASEEEAIKTTLTVWGPAEDQSPDYGEWLQTTCEAFKKEHPNWDITFDYGTCSEGDAGKTVTQDVSASADVYMFANDQLQTLIDAGAISELGGSTADYVKSTNSQAIVDSITVDGKEIKIYAFPDANNCPWGELKVDVVLECSGFYTSKEKAQAHINAGARKVVISAPAGNDLPTIVYNTNHETLKASDTIISAASCTTNCLAPMADALNKFAPIQSGIMCTIHAYTGDQMTLDGPQRKGDLRRSRAAAVNIVPNSTGAAKAIGLVIPELNGKLIGAAQRVPTPTGSTTILTAVVKKAGVTKEDINAAMKAAANESFGYNEDEIVSSDIVGMRFGSLFDATQTLVNQISDDLYEVQVVSWYDNENSYTSQMVRTIKYFSELA